MNKTTRVLGVIVLLLGLLVLSQRAQAQNVQLKGKTFTLVDSAKSQDTKTDYTFVDSNHNVYPIYLSKNGKAFIIRKSKSGKDYRQYLPKISEMFKEANNDRNVNKSSGSRRN